jgi:hypothetical protein
MSVNINASQKLNASYKSHSQTKPLDDPSLEKRMGDIVARTVQEISADYEKRRLGSRNDPTLLNGGIWMANEYYHALQEAGKTAASRLKFLTEKGYFYHVLPPKQFENILSKDAVSGYVLSSIALKKNCKPSEALSAIKTNLSLLDCSMVCQIGQYQAILEVLGEAKFNKLFSRDGKFPMVIGQYGEKINSLCQGFLSGGSNKSGIKGERPVNIGERHCFLNDEKYRERHSLMGDSQAMNVIPIHSTPGKQKFVGFGLPGAGVSEEEIEQYLIDQYNQKPLDLEPLNDAIASQLHSAGKASYKPVCDYLDLQATDEQKEKSWEAFAAYVPSEAHTYVKGFLDSVSVPLSKETIQDKGFGYNPQCPLKFNIPFIQELIRKRLEDI